MKHFPHLFLTSSAAAKRPQQMEILFQRTAGFYDRPNQYLAQQGTLCLPEKKKKNHYNDCNQAAGL